MLRQDMLKEIMKAVDQPKYCNCMCHEIKPKKKSKKIRCLLCGCNFTIKASKKN